MLHNRGDLETASEGIAPGALLSSLQSGKISMTRSSKPVKYNRKSKYLSSLRGYFAVAIILIQNVVDLTETNTQIAPRNIPFERFLGVTRRAARDQQEIKRTITHQGPFKLSPTRIRLSNDESYSLFRKFKGSSEPATRKMINEQIVRRRNLTPAYEFTHLVSGTDNQVKVSEFERQISLTLDAGAANTNRGEESSTATKLDRGARNNLPKPQMSSLSGKSKHRGILSRAVRGNANKAGKSKRDNQDSNDEDQAQESDEEDGIGEMIGKGDHSDDYEIETPTQDDSEPSGRRSASFNLETVDDDNAIARADTLRGTSASPIYPPGDLDILYSDALLVYVKDFNQFIRH